MAKNIKEIAEGLGAEIIGPVPETGGGVFGAAQVAQDAKALSTAAVTGVGSIGAMRDFAEELDAIVEDAMRTRRLQAWRPSPEDFAVLESITAATGKPLEALLDDALRLLLQQWSRQQAKARQRAESGHDDSARKPIWETARELAAAIPEEIWTEWPHNPEGMDLDAADVNDPRVRQSLMDELGRRMSHLSETASCAGWLNGLEERVPRLCDQAVTTGKLQAFGGTVVCPGLAARLLAMRDKLGYWVVPAIKGGYEPYLPPGKA